MSRYWPVAIVVVGAVVLLGLLAGEGMSVLGVSAGFAVLALVVVVMLSTAAADGQRRSDPRAQRRLREAAQAMPGAATAVPAAGAEPARPAAPDAALAESRAEVERLGGELRRAREKEKEAEDRARASAAAATAAATAAADNEKRLEASVKEGRAEVDRLQLAQRFTKLRPGVRILYVSGVVHEASAREAIAGEDADFLEKPFEGETFTTKVRELLPAAPRPQ